MGRAVQAGEQRNRTMKEIVRAGWQGAPLLKYTNRLMESISAFEAGELRNRNDCVQVPSAECKCRMQVPSASAECKRQQASNSRPAPAAMPPPAHHIHTSPSILVPLQSLCTPSAPCAESQHREPAQRASKEQANCKQRKQAKRAREESQQRELAQRCTAGILACTEGLPGGCAAS